MAQAWYTTREQVKRALDSAETARNNDQVDRAIGAASRYIDNLLHRRLAPWDGTRYFNYDPLSGSGSWRLRLDENDLVSVTTLTSGGTTVSSSDYFLEPVNIGPPYDSIEIDLSSNAVFTFGDTRQRAAAITGTWGFWDEQEAVGTLADSLDASASDTATVTWTDPAQVGVGSILKIDSERVIVTGRSFVDSTQNLGGSGLTASAADNTVTVSNSAGFFVGETIRIDSESMLVVDLRTATTLLVKRAFDGSVLAAHSAAVDIYGYTGVETARAQLGSSLAAHTSSDVVYRWIVPPLVGDLCVAEAITQLLVERGGYARQDGELATKPAGGGLRALREQVLAAYGRRARARAI